MQSAFWSNTIWFILLGISTIFEMIIVFSKAKNRKLILALFFTISGMTFSFEATIMFFFKSYKYYPMIIPQFPHDLIIGNFFSQFSVTATALLLAVLGLKYYWYFIFSVIYYIIEESFIRLGIYSHSWWYKTWMTFVGLILLFYLTKKIYKTSLICIGRVTLYVYEFFSFFNLYLITLLWAFNVSGIIGFNMNIFTDALTSFAFLTLFNMFIICIPCIFVYFSKLEWIWKTIITIALYTVIYFECKMNLMYIKQGWFLNYTTIEIFGTYFYVFMIDNLYKKCRG